MRYGSGFQRFQYRLPPQKPRESYQRRMGAGAFCGVRRQAANRHESEHIPRATRGITGSLSIQWASHGCRQTTFQSLDWSGREHVSTSDRMVGGQICGGLLQLCKAVCFPQEVSRATITFLSVFGRGFPNRLLAECAQAGTTC